MPIKFSCNQCGTSLRVPDEHIGKKARCPKCNEKNTVPETSQRESSSSGLESDFGGLGSASGSSLNPPQAVPAATPVGGIGLILMLVSAANA
jgi:DNA-directed RNA polymerase subunit RPC12/RpoP